MVSGGMSCVKYLLFVFNLLFAVSGIAILVIGAVIQSNFQHYITFGGEEFVSAPILLIIVGCIIFVVAFFGCCGAVRENHCMVITFSVFLVIIFILELAAGITAVTMRDDIQNVISKKMKESMKDYNNDTSITKTWNVMQNDLSCCGADNASDWMNTPYYELNQRLPSSCCIEDDPNKQCDFDIPSSHVHNQGCLPILVEDLQKYAIVVGGVGIGIAFVQLVGVVFACCLAKSIRSEYESV